MKPRLQPLLVIWGEDDLDIVYTLDRRSARNSEEVSRSVRLVSDIATEVE